MNNQQTYWIAINPQGRILLQTLSHKKKYIVDEINQRWDAVHGRKRPCTPLHTEKTLIKEGFRFRRCTLNFLEDY
jgi:hypothetical protein